MKISLVSNRNVACGARDLVPTSKKPSPFTNCTGDICEYFHEHQFSSNPESFFSTASSSSAQGSSHFSPLQPLIILKNLNYHSPDIATQHLLTTNSKFVKDFNQAAVVMIMSQSIPTGYIPPGNPRGLAQKHCPGGRDLTFESCPGAGNSTRAGILWKFKVKHFVRVLVLSVINTGCPKIAKKWGTLHY